MENRRVFWVCLGWFGLTQVARWGIAILRVDVWPGNVVALGAGLLLAGVAGYALATDAESGPTDRDYTFWAAVLGAVLGTLSLLF